MEARTLVKALAFVGGAALAGNLGAVPKLQVGALSSGTSCTTTSSYVPYSANSNNPTEEDTAITTGFYLCAGGAFGPNTVGLGGQFGTGDDYGDIDNDLSVFDGKGAILIATVPNADPNALTSEAFTINGFAAFGQAETNFFFPDNHAPLDAGNGVDYLFFDIGDFTDIDDGVVNFAQLSDTGDGSITTLLLGGTIGVDWIHFDLIALETTETPQGQSTRIRTSLESSANSHDVTWKEDGGPPTEVPEPGVLSLAGLALLGLGLIRRRRR